MGSPDKSPAHSYCAPKHILREGGPQSALTRGGGGGGMSETRLTPYSLMWFFLHLLEMHKQT